MVLRDLPPLLREEPGFASVLGRSSAVLAVPEPARALTIAGLAHLSSRRPIVVAAPTTGDADRVANDLRAYLGPDAVDTFPAWETLPFERISPSVETMGRRLRTMWRLAVARAGAPASWWPRCGRSCSGSGPHVEDVEPVVVRPGEQRDRDELVAALVGAGYRREEVVEHRGRARRARARSSTCSPPPPTGPCASTSGATRSTGSPSSRSATSAPPTTSSGSRSSAAASCSPPTRCGSGPSGSSPSSRGAASSGSGWPRARSSTGMESWLPWLTEGEHVLFDLVGRRRARAAARAPPHARPRRRPARTRRPTWPPSLAKTWGAVASGGEDGLPAPAPPVRPAAVPHRRRRRGRSPPRRRAPTSPPSRRWASRPRPATPSGSCASSPSWPADGYRIVVAADGEGSAARLRSLLVQRTASRPPSTSRRSSAAASCPPSSWR